MPRRGVSQQAYDSEGRVTRVVRFSQPIALGGLAMETAANEGQARLQDPGQRPEHPLCI